MKVFSVDQSTSALGLVLTDNGRIVHQECLAPKTDKYLERIIWLRDAVRVKLEEFDPDIVVMEDYAYTAHSSADAMLKELGGVLKVQFYECGYLFDRDAVIKGPRCAIVTSSGQMKKFTLGNGSLKKDTSYLLTVYEKTKIRFPDDNIADAYMHAHMAGVIISILRGKTLISNLYDYQQEALLSSGVARKKKLTMKAALKMSEEEKRELVGW